MSEKVKKYVPIPKKTSFNKDEIKRVIDQAVNETIEGRVLTEHAEHGIKYIRSRLYKLFLLGEFDPL